MHPLDGIKVTDITTMINGPYAAMLLADMGADVIKVEPPDGDPWRNVAGGFLAFNRGKRSIVVDLKRKGAIDIIHRLVAESDILVENARWGVRHRLNMDYESLKKIKPDMIYLSLLGHGSTGPYCSLPGYDPLLQTRSGQMVAQGGIGQPPVFHRIAVNDLACPLLGAYGAVLALLVKARTGKGQNVETSLTNASIAMQSGDFIGYEGLRHEYPGAPDIKGLNATNRLYQAGDGRWIIIFCPEESHWQSLCRAVEMATLLSDQRFDTPEKRKENDEVLAGILSRIFQSKPSSYWLAALPQADIPSALAQSSEEVMTDEHCLANHLIDEREHDVLGSVKQHGLGFQFTRMSGIIRGPAPSLGAHTKEILTELGYTTDQIDQFAAEKIISIAK